MLISACSEGRVDIVSWLRQEYKLGVEEVRAQRSRALRVAVEGGHFQVLRQLKFFGLQDKDGAQQMNRFFRIGAAKGHVSVLHCLRVDYTMYKKGIIRKELVYF